MESLAHWELTRVLGIFRLAFADGLHGFVVFIQKRGSFVFALVKASLFTGRLILAGKATLYLTGQLVIKFGNYMLATSWRQSNQRRKLVEALRR